jgi:hypothetical protein
MGFVPGPQRLDFQFITFTIQRCSILQAYRTLVRPLHRIVMDSVV